DVITQKETDWNTLWAACDRIWEELVRLETEMGQLHQDFGEDIPKELLLGDLGDRLAEAKQQKNMEDLVEINGELINFKNKYDEELGKKIEDCKNSLEEIRNLLNPIDPKLTKSIKSQCEEYEKQLSKLS